MNRQAGSPYQKGFETLWQENAGTRLAVIGSLPCWLTGSLFRTGPSQFEIGGKSCNHWFDGLAMLHRFDLANGGVYYANRYLHSEVYCSSKREGRLTRRSFATDPCFTLFQRIQAIFDGRPADNANINIVRTAGSYMALAETPQAVPFDPRTLERVRDRSPSSPFAGHLTTAHPQYDASAQTSYNYLLKFGRTSAYQIVATNEQNGNSTLLASVSAQDPSYVHSIGMSEN